MLTTNLEKEKKVAGWYIAEQVKYNRKYAKHMKYRCEPKVKNLLKGI